MALHDNTAKVLTGRCYCGEITFSTSQKPQTVVYCHCEDCRRATGGPIAAFAAFEEKSVAFLPNDGRKISCNPGATRTFCDKCGSSLTGRYDYLPGQIYVSLGVIDQADELAPEIHSHEAERLSWLHIQDELERIGTSARSKIGDFPK